MNPMHHQLSRVGLMAACILTLAACGADSGGGLAGPQSDAGSPPQDAGAGAADAASAAETDTPAATDAGQAQPDAAAADAGQAQPDGGTPDAGQTPTDAGAVDAGAVDAAAEADTASPQDAGSEGGWGPAMCPASTGSMGFNIGQQVGNLVVHDCDTGKARTIDEVCGAKATWIFVAHSHCPTCKATAQYTAKVAAAVADKDVAVVHILYIDDATTCPDWRSKYKLAGLDNVRVYLDKSGATWSAIKTKNYTAAHAFLDGKRQVTYRAHGLSSGGVQKQIDDALAKGN